MTNTPEDTSIVRFTVKELFGRIDQKLDGLDVKLDSKADHQALVDLASRVAVLESSVQFERGLTAGAKVIGGLLFAIFVALLPIAAHYIQ